MSRKITIPKNSQTEFKIENYLEDHVDLIEDGLQLIRRQYKLYYKSRSSLGDVDLFCQGEDGAQVIVELKSGELKKTTRMSNKATNNNTFPTVVIFL